MPNTAETIEKLATNLAYQKILLSMKDYKTLEELEQYIKTLLEVK